MNRPSTPDPEESMSTIEVVFDEDWTDTQDRIARAEVGIDRLADITDNPLEVIRLRGKAEGLRLALSYMRECRDIRECLDMPVLTGAEA
jgi:hypothetical protein